MYDVRAIANWFIERSARSDSDMTAMRLQKLSYIAHGWSLAFDEPLVHEAVEAWKWGPVFRTVYREFSEFGSRPINRMATAFDGTTLLDREIDIESYSEPDPDATRNFLEDIWQRYKDFSASELMNLTHREGTPWHQVLTENGGTLPRYAIISNDRIQRYYKDLLEELNRGEAVTAAS